MKTKVKNNSQRKKLNNKSVKRKSPNRKSPNKESAKKLSPEMVSEGLHLDAGGEWPQPRRILFRPERYNYIKKIDQPKTCVFCDAREKGIQIESLCIYRSKHSMIVLNKYPYNNGHLLVLPQQHIGELLKLTDEEYLDLMTTVKLATKALTKLYAPAAMNLGMNHGTFAGAGIPEHLHFHIIPRWSGDLNFFPLIAETKVVIETLEQTYQRFMSYFSKEG